MIYTHTYLSPIGRMTLTADALGLTGIWYNGQKHFPAELAACDETRLSPVLESTKVWLDCYFDGGCPDFTPPLHPQGTPFQQAVWQLLLTIPYGTTATYKFLAEHLARERGLRTMSAQAVGGAVGRNPISIIIPCHRIVGSNGSLTGYAGGIERKVHLLTLEHALRDDMFVPRHGTAL